MARVVVAEDNGALVGFVTVDPETMYLDQIVVAPEHWGSGVALTLLDEAKRLSPSGLELLVNKDNARAIRFYEKHGFDYAGEDKNPVSGKPVNSGCAWRAAPRSQQLSAAPASAAAMAGVEGFGIHLEISELFLGDHHRLGHARHLAQRAARLSASPAWPSPIGTSRVVR